MDFCNKCIPSWKADCQYYPFLWHHTTINTSCNVWAKIYSRLSTTTPEIGTTSYFVFWVTWLFAVRYKHVLQIVPAYSNAGKLIEIQYQTNYVPLIFLYDSTADDTVAGLLASAQHLEGPATSHLGTGFAWFPCVYKRMLRWFPRLQVATACFSCSTPHPHPPGLWILSSLFIIVYMYKTTAKGQQPNSSS